MATMMRDEPIYGVTLESIRIGSRFSNQTFNFVQIRPVIRLVKPRAGRYRGTRAATVNLIFCSLFCTL